MINIWPYPPPMNFQAGNQWLCSRCGGESTEKSYYTLMLSVVEIYIICKMMPVFLETFIFMLVQNNQTIQRHSAKSIVSRDILLLNIQSVDTLSIF